MNKFGDAAVAAISAVLTLAIVATLVSNKAKTAQVFAAGGGAFADVIQAAVNPYGGYTPRASYGDY